MCVCAARILCALWHISYAECDQKNAKRSNRNVKKKSFKRNAKAGKGRRQRPCGAKYAHKKHKVEKYKKQKTKKRQGRNFIAGAATRRHTQQINNNYSKKVTAKKVYEFFVQARERCKKYCKKQTKTKQQTKADTTKGPHPPLPSRLPGPRPVTYKHTSVRLKIALLQLDYKNARQKY